jgi:UDP-2,4-diacetamido-2,4,6-trideoxy-beta-L-altropyranose hydrolase
LKNPLMLIRADASTAIGSGHVMRCLALAKAWQDAGGSVCHLAAESIPALDQRFAVENIKQVKFAEPANAEPVNVKPGSMEDAEQTSGCARRLDAAWLVVDGYRFEPGYVRRLKSEGLRVLFLDDDARFDFYEADIVLNQNINASAEIYSGKVHRKTDPDIRLLLGSDYVLLRPEFLAEPRQRKTGKECRKVLVTMGGSDPDNVTEKVLQALSQVTEIDFEVTVVVGGGNPYYEGLQALTENLGPKFRLERSPSSMAPLMTRADIAISAAGGTCWELAFLGVPMMLIVITTDQDPNASAISAKGAALNLGWHANLSPRQIADELKKLANDVDGRRDLSERGQKLVDGQGPARVVAIMQNSLG